MRCSTLLLPVLASLAAAAPAQPTEGAPPSFRSIELRGGGVVTVRHGPTRSVAIREGNPDRPIRAEGDRLVIDRCGNGCPRGHRIAVDVVTPLLAEIAVADGGRIEVGGGFPRQAAVAASVSSGGTIDIRSLDAMQVAAAVAHGGRILAHPRRALNATVSNGGNVTYWGDAAVTRSVRHGGVVERGDPADLRRPLAGIDERLAPPPVPANPATPRRPRTH